MIRSYKKVSKLNNSIQGGMTYHNLSINNHFISKQILYNSSTGNTGMTGNDGPIYIGIYTGPTGYNITGPTGPNGITNIIYGSKGLTGPTGPTGYQTNTGPIGPLGYSGISYKGSTGYTGLDGSTGITGPTSPSIVYSNISSTFSGVSSIYNQPITTINLSSACYIQWYVNITSMSMSSIVTIYFSMDQDIISIPLTGTGSISGSGIYNSDIVFQCYYNGNSSDTFTVSYQIVYIQLFN